MSTLNWSALVVLAACGVHVGSFRLSGRHMFGPEGAAPAAGRPAMSNAAWNGPQPLPSRTRNKFMENEGLFEGDIMIKGYDPTLMPIAVGPLGQFWPGGRMYYELHESLADKSDTIAEALTDFTKKTCLEFIRRNGDTNIKDYILMRGDTPGCSSYKGMQGGEQEISLQREGCLWRGTIIHEVMHALGFWHEQSRPDRDDFVTIVWDNIETGKERNFRKSDSTEVTDVGTGYDIFSIMHYSLFSFAKNPKEPTIVPKFDVDWTKVGGTEELSPLDAEQIRKVYKCPSLRG